ncbi:Flp family type IVb pilin [Serratia marcescens]|nr:Flp family type IVb pilin [Serratia marcescens]
MACRNVKNAEQNERGITAIEYAIIGVAMASALFFIFDKGGFIESLSTAWNTMSTKITASGNILK